MNYTELAKGSVYWIEYHDPHPDYSHIGEAMFLRKNRTGGADFLLPGDVHPAVPRTQTYHWSHICRPVPTPTKEFPPDTTEKPTMKTIKQPSLKKGESIATIIHKVDLSDREMRDIGQEVGRVRQEIADLEAQLKAATQDFKSRIEAKKVGVTAQETKLANAYEMREVQAILTFEPDKRKKHYLDIEDRKIVLRTEDMTPADWQLDMFKKKEVVGKKPKGADEQPPVVHPNAVGDEVIAAAMTMTRLEIDPDDRDIVENDPKKLISLFKKKAKTMQWPDKIRNHVAKLATVKANEGIDAVAEFLRPFCIRQD